MSYTVRDYQTGAALDGRASKGLVRASDEEGSGTGAVVARLDERGIWLHVRADEADDTARTVYVESDDESAAAAVLGRKGGRANTPAQLAQRRAAGPRGGRPTTLLLVDDLGRTVGITTASPGRVGEVVEYGLRVAARTRPDGVIESSTFTVEGRARLARMPRDMRWELAESGRRWDVQ